MDVELFLNKVYTEALFRSIYKMFIEINDYYSYQKRVPMNFNGTKK